MVQRFDIQLNNNDIVINDNDIVLVVSDDQHVVDTINACPGWWKENFSDGVAILTYLKGKNIQQDLARSMKLQLLSDGYNSSPIINFDANGNLTIDPNVSL